MTQTNRSILGFDFGSKSIGVAIGQEVTGTASPLPALKARDGIPDWDAIAAIYDEWKPNIVVVGLPLNMDGTTQQVTFAAKKFANRLHNKFKIPVETYDERLTTTDAKARLFELGGYKKLEKGKIDSVSACLIIESWLEAQYS
ncbi:Holliday junction resolvase RuvX [Paraneptunicella aestuarii]|uniref:Holliday junction resolvase RuvX n=1 Tax=Paraneptunicella aestuarii TaxID=2831148 RepID=UPI001E4EC1F8|nr:Holliday junction resolvase RuvX [Paraneptunicella aestuarii]UAA39791.1 Holliday junction resolvase RuvX [Paraneptunicella aestuarii]